MKEQINKIPKGTTTEIPQTLKSHPSSYLEIDIADVKYY